MGLIFCFQFLKLSFKKKKNFVEVCFEKRCNTPPYNFVCGSNDITYPNECFLNSVSCLTKAKIEVAYNGHCKNVDADSKQLSNIFLNKCI